MKVGMIFECGDEGADIDVCRHLARRIRPSIRVEPDPLGNKRNLLNICGESAAQLLSIGCQKVFIIWDLYPSFKRDDDPCRRNDKELIFESLSDAGVGLDKVELICIEAELETWLLADYKAVRDVLRMWNPKAKTGRLKRTHQLKNPKRTLEHLFETQIGSTYEPHKHAKKIVKAMQNLNRLRRIDSFRRFETKLTT